MVLGISKIEGVVSLLKFRNGAPGGIRTPDQVVRSHLLYPAELRVHSEGAQFNVSETNI